MQLKISKTLESILARATFNAAKANATHSLKDILVLELLREEGSLAYQILSARLKDWELYQVRLRLEREVLETKAKEGEAQQPERFFKDFAEELRQHAEGIRSISTGHALQRIVGDRTTAASRVLEMYGITAETVAEELRKFASGDEFRYPSI